MEPPRAMGALVLLRPAAVKTSWPDGIAVCWVKASPMRTGATSVSMNFRCVESTVYTSSKVK